MKPTLKYYILVALAVVAMLMVTIIVVITGIMVSNAKPNINQNKILINSIVRNLTQASSAVLNDYTNETIEWKDEIKLKIL